MMNNTIVTLQTVQNKLNAINSLIKTLCNKREEINDKYTSLLEKDIVSFLIKELTATRQIEVYYDDEYEDIVIAITATKQFYDLLKSYSKTTIDFIIPNTDTQLKLEYRILKENPSIFESDDWVVTFLFNRKKIKNFKLFAEYIQSVNNRIRYGDLTYQVLALENTLKPLKAVITLLQKINNH